MVANTGSLWNYSLSRIRPAELQHFVAIGTDITEQKAIEHALQAAKEQAEAANRIKTDFLSMISHEIRTPLNGIVGTIELLAQQPSAQSAHVDILKDASSSLLVLIDDLLDLSRIEAGRLQLEHSPFDLPKLVHSVSALYEAGAAAKGISLQTAVDTVLPASCIGDPFRLKQVLMNLVSNAVKFTSHGSVRLSCYRVSQETNADYYQFEVRDTGNWHRRQGFGSHFRDFQSGRQLTRPTLRRQRPGSCDLSAAREYDGRANRGEQCSWYGINVRLCNSARASQS